MEQFIETVKQFPILWNTKSKDYHNLTKKDVVWSIIVEKIQNPAITDVKTAKNEWKKLRDSHRESIKRMKEKTIASGQDASPAKNNWKYAELLEFLLPHIKNRKRTDNSSVYYEFTLPGTSNESHNTEMYEKMHHDENTKFEQSENEDSNMTPEPRQKKRKVMQPCERCHIHNTDEVNVASNTRHPLNLFFDSMCESTKRLPDWIQRDIKKKLLHIVCEAEENYENCSRQPCKYEYTSPSASSTPLHQNDINLDNL